jgi:transcriptional regulatory protein LevR/transcriptional regulator with AAA-type ATPase domain
MQPRKYELLDQLKKEPQAMTAAEIADSLDLDRANVSRYLNELYKEKLVKKLEGRPVRYLALVKQKVTTTVTFDNLIGRDESLKSQIQKSKAAIMYPPHGLHTLIFGETGTGKTMFAECMYHFAKSSHVVADDAPFITFNCADYAQNPQLLYGHIFGVKKGAFTGADSTRVGLLAQADGGILFLDEIHRLPPEGQEMLFTFIDKGIFRALGDTVEQHAEVLILGATTEQSDLFLKTFNRRIPMQIELPPLNKRTLDERLGIIKEFLQQEANRLKQPIEIEKNCLFAFLLYQAEGNIGQLKRDLKLVCAKAFLYYQTKNDQEKLFITQNELPLTVQKGLLRLKEETERLRPLLNNKSRHLTFNPGTEEMVWSQDPAQNMEVYETLTATLQTMEPEKIDELDLEQLIINEGGSYFDTYLAELSHVNMYKDIISEHLWQLTKQFYVSAKKQLGYEYDEKAHFAFALHINSMIERIRKGNLIKHPRLNEVRRKYSKEFQLAIELSSLIEDEYDVLIPLDEIGFMTMFLTREVGGVPASDCLVKKVGVIVLMHGKSSATSLLETAQELLGTEEGIAFNMPLTSPVNEAYGQLKNYVADNSRKLSEGLLLLTDMGSPTNFGKLLTEETGVATRVISLTSTMIVLESLRLASLGRNLEDIYQNVLNIFPNLLPKPDYAPKTGKKVIVVACFTGEGVAKRLNEVVSKLVDPAEYEVVQMQYLERELFKEKIERILLTQDIAMIIGTMEINYHGIPYIPALNLFDYPKILDFQQMLGTRIALKDVVATLTNEFSKDLATEEVLVHIQDALEAIQRGTKLVIEQNVRQGIMIHLAFLINNIKKGQHSPEFVNATAFLEEQQALGKIAVDQLNRVAKRFNIEFTPDDEAYVVKMLVENEVKL